MAIGRSSIEVGTEYSNSGTNEPLGMFARFKLQEQLWRQHIKNFKTEVIVAITLFALSQVFQFVGFVNWEYNSTIRLIGICIVPVCFTWVWLMIPKGPAILSTKHGEPIQASYMHPRPKFYGLEDVENLEVSSPSNTIIGSSNYH